MYLPRPLKLLLFALTVWLPLYMVAFVALIMVGAPRSEAGFQTLMLVHGATMIVEVGLMIFYIVHVFKARTVASDKRALWGIALFCGAPIAMPVYFFAHVWPEPKEWAIDNVVR